MTWVHEQPNTTQPKGDAVTARNAETGQQSVSNSGIERSLRSEQGELSAPAANLKTDPGLPNPLNKVEKRLENKTRTHSSQDDMDLDKITSRNREQTVTGHVDLSMTDSQGSAAMDVGGSDQVSETQISTQQLEDQAAKLRLQDIVRTGFPPCLCAVVMSLISDQLEPSDQHQSLEETQPIDSMPQTLRPNENIPGSTAKVELSQTKVDELESYKRNDAALSGGGLRRVRESTESTIALGDQDIVQCQCGWNEEEDDMVG